MSRGTMPAAMLLARAAPVTRARGIPPCYRPVSPRRPRHDESRSQRRLLRMGAASEVCDQWGKRRADHVSRALVALHLEGVATAVDPHDAGILARGDDLLELRQRLDERIVRPLDEQLRHSDLRQMLGPRLLRLAG